MACFACTGAPPSQNPGSASGTLFCVLSKNLPFQGICDLVSSRDTHLIMGTVPCPKPKKLGHRKSNRKYEFLIVNCISLHVGIMFRAMNLMSQFLGLGKGTVSLLNSFNLV